MKTNNYGIIMALLLAALTAGCNTPFSLSANVLGAATVTANFPNGIVVPAKVVPSAAVTQTKLLVPADSPAADQATATVHGAGGTSAVVPVEVAAVPTETLVVPAK
jgi:hypothetical protein